MVMLQELITFALGGVCFFTGLSLARYVSKRKGQKNAAAYLHEHKDQFGLVKIYDLPDEKGGVVGIYAFKQPLKMPALRSLAGETAMKQAEMNIGREELIEFIGEMEEAGNAGKITTLFTLLKNLEQRINLAAHEETLIDLACVYFLLEGEDPLTISQDTQKRKRQLIEADETARAFFLIASYRITNDYSDISDSDILSYLKESKTKVESERERRKRLQHSVISSMKSVDL